jgi:hypothetical protein
MPLRGRVLGSAAPTALVAVLGAVVAGLTPWLQRCCSAAARFGGCGDARAGHTGRRLCYRRWPIGRGTHRLKPVLLRQAGSYSKGASPIVVGLRSDEHRRNGAQLQVAGIEVGALFKDHFLLRLPLPGVVPTHPYSILSLRADRFDYPDAAVGDGPINFRRVPQLQVLLLIVVSMQRCPRGDALCLSQ